MYLENFTTLLSACDQGWLAQIQSHFFEQQRVSGFYPLRFAITRVEGGRAQLGDRAQAAAQHYFRKPASRLTPYEAARLAVMLPQPKRFEKTPGSGYIASRASTIVARMRDAELP